MALEQGISHRLALGGDTTIDIKTGLSRPEVLPWTESVTKLTDKQRVSAEIAYSSLFLKKVHNETKALLPELHKRQLYSGMADDEILAQRVGGLVEAHVINTAVKELDHKEGQAVLEKFALNHENSSELLLTAESIDEELTPKKDKVYAKAKKIKPLRASIKNELIRMRTALTVGKDTSSLLYEPTETTKADESISAAGWGQTIRNTVILEGGPHLAGGLTAAVNLEHIHVDTPTKLIVSAVAVNVGLWYMMYGPNTKQNLDYLDQTGASIALPAKVAHQAAELSGKDDGERRKIAKRAHWADLTFWEGVYGAEAILLGTQTDAKTALQYWAGAAAFGLVKNLGVYGAFQTRNWRNRRALRGSQVSSGTEEIIEPHKEDIPDTAGTAELPIGANEVTLHPGKETTIA